VVNTETEGKGKMSLAYGNDKEAHESVAELLDTDVLLHPLGKQRAVE
jgi:hypothetical protein